MALDDFAEHAVGAPLGAGKVVGAVDGDEAEFGAVAVCPLPVVGDGPEDVASDRDAVVHGGADGA